MNRLWKHLQNWTEGYLFFPLGVLAIIGAPQLVYFLTKRKPAENVDWLVDYASVAMKALLIILFTALAKQATGSGTWMTKEEKIAHPYLATIDVVKVMLTFYGFLWLFTH